MLVTIIVAADEKNGIGIDGKMPWHLPADLKRFKTLTTGHCIIMGRKSYEALPFQLPGRPHIIITRNKDFKADGCTIVNSIQDAIQVAKNLNETEAFVIGGAEIIKETLAQNLADKIELTRIHHRFPADTFLAPNIEAGFNLEAIEKHDADEKNLWGYSFITYLR